MPWSWLWILTVLGLFLNHPKASGHAGFLRKYLYLNVFDSMFREENSFAKFPNWKCWHVIKGKLCVSGCIWMTDVKFLNGLNEGKDNMFCRDLTAENCEITRHRCLWDNYVKRPNFIKLDIISIRMIRDTTKRWIMSPEGSVWRKNKTRWLLMKHNQTQYRLNKKFQSVTIITSLRLINTVLQL